MEPAEAKYPEEWRTISLDRQPLALPLDQPATIISTLDPQSAIPEENRVYLLKRGITTILIIPLVSGDQAYGRLTFRFAHERNFDSEGLKFAKGLATQGSCVIQLARFVEAARQTAILEERNRLAREIHDSLAQTFAAIAMQLTVAKDELSARKGDPLRKVRLAIQLAEVGLAEARRSALSLRSSVIEEAGLVRAVQMLVERSNLAGRLRCNFRSNRIPEEKLPVKIEHELFRITQEAMTNAIRHGKATLILVTLRWKKECVGMPAVIGTRYTLKRS